MRYIANGNGYLREVSFGADIYCNGLGCTEYTGEVPEGYNSLVGWFAVNCDQLHRWKIVEGNLVEDSEAKEPAVYEPPIPLSKTKLWENKNITDAFNAQTIALDLSEYDGVDIVYYVEGTTDVTLSTGFIPIGLHSNLWYVTATYGHRLHRDFRVKSDGIEFSTGTNTGATAGNKVCIPRYIYGWRGIGVDIKEELKYQRVEWIGTSGTQYINTEIVPTNHMVEVKYDSEERDAAEHVFGTEAGPNYFHFTIYDNKYYWGLKGKESSGGAWSSGVKTLLYNYGDNHAIVLDGVTLGAGEYISSAKSLTLCRRTATNFKGKYYYFKVTDRATGQLVRNMYPCYRKADGVIGMYDTVSKKFFPNAGTGEFTKGADIETPPQDQPKSAICGTFLCGEVVAGQ